MSSTTKEGVTIIIGDDAKFTATKDPFFCEKLVARHEQKREQKKRGRTDPNRSVIQRYIGWHGPDAYRYRMSRVVANVKRAFDDVLGSTEDKFPSIIIKYTKPDLWIGAYNCAVPGDPGALSELLLFDAIEWMEAQGLCVQEQVDDCYNVTATTATRITQ